MSPLVWAWRSLGESPTDRLGLRIHKTVRAEQAQEHLKRTIVEEPNLSDETDIASISELESVYSATESDKDFIADDDYIEPGAPDPSYSPSGSESSSQSSMDITENYLVRHFLVRTGPPTNTTSPLLGKPRRSTSLRKDTDGQRGN
jgi:hypothetical protein